MAEYFFQVHFEPNNKPTHSKVSERIQQWWESSVLKASDFKAGYIAFMFETAESPFSAEVMHENYPHLASVRGDAAKHSDVIALYQFFLPDSK